MTQTVTGGCLCGKVRYSISQPVEKVIACHCTHCQKASGSGVSHNTPIPLSALTMTAGTPKLYEDMADSGNILNRYFCGDCGSPLYSQRTKTPEMVVIKVGTLDDSNAMKLIMNIWTKSSRPWMAIDQSTACFPENRPA
jgi:hypothetical protein